MTLTKIYWLIFCFVRGNSAMDKNKGLFRRQMSDSIITATFIVLSGGFQDAYTYCCRGKVFANAQTGNIVLMSAGLLSGDFSHSAKYLVPLLSFFAGIMAAELVHRRFKNYEKIHWRQMILAAEVLLLFVVGFLPQGFNALANAAVSFVCALQVQTFHKLHGCVYASTMCIGNIRSGAEALVAFFKTGEREALEKSLMYFLVIALFALGAGFGSLAAAYIGERSIWISCGLLLAGLITMFVREK